MCSESNDIVAELQEALGSYDNQKDGVSSGGLDCTAVHRGIADSYLVKTNRLNYRVHSCAAGLSHYPKTRALVVETGSMRVTQWMASRHLHPGGIFIPMRWRRYDIEISDEATFFIVDFLDRWDAKQVHERNHDSCGMLHSEDFSCGTRHRSSDAPVIRTKPARGPSKKGHSNAC
ncbi:hypothetical protein AAFG07_33120 [Bradyrhizobium sp. B097]|uniref:hypothetical protein n=1 Tax=Bradyrhizobium sp. B097 TaxID=3140244 RepID=UPI0031835F19